MGAQLRIDQCAGAVGARHEGISRSCCHYSGRLPICSRRFATQERFEALLRDTATYLQTAENDIWQANTLPKIGLLEDESLPQYVPVLQAKLARHKCQQMLSSFAQLDSDNDGAQCEWDAANRCATA